MTIHTTKNTGTQSGLSADVWRLWVRQYGAAKAIEFAVRQGFTSGQIRAVNRECKSAAISTQEKAK